MSLFQSRKDSRNAGQRQDRKAATVPPPLARSGSFLGTLKSIVSTPLNWFSSTGEEFEDKAGKRRRIRNAPVTEEGGEEADEHRQKRKRMRPPEPQEDEQLAQQQQQYQPKPAGYNDVPEHLLGPHTSAAHRRTTSHDRRGLGVSTASKQRLSRRTLSPGTSTSYNLARGIARTQSMDPPARRGPSYDVSMAPLPISRDVSMGAIHDVSMSPSSRFALRDSLTPQPSGQAFGPKPQRRDRHPSEPPPLAALMSNPIFVKPPSQTQARELAQQPTMTLGSLAEEHRASHPIVRQHSSLLIGSQAGQPSNISGGLGHIRPINAAEKALQELNEFKNPLLPSRLRGSPTIPDMFKPKKVHVPTPMQGRDRDGKPRLGMSEKQAAKGREEGKRPYAGQGGMKKLLARRRMEEEEEKEKEKAAAIEEDVEEVQAESSALQAIEANETERPAARPETIGGKPQSSLRVGRSRTGRDHIARPVFKPKGRFSAKFDEEEGEDLMQTPEEEAREKEKQLLEEAAKKAPVFNIPEGFSFAKDTKPIQFDLDLAWKHGQREPPIAALPFSISKPATPSVPSISAPVEKPKDEEVSKSAFAAPPPAAAPSIALIPPSPGTSAFAAPSAQPAEAQPSAPKETPAAPPAIPDFFSKSSIFSKPSAAIPVPSFSFAPAAPAAPAPAKEAAEEPRVGEEGAAAPAPAPQQFQNFLFGAGAAPSATGGVSDVSKPAAQEGQKEPSAAPLFAGFGNGAKPEAAPAPAKEEAPAAPAPSDTTAAAKPSAFDFAAPPKEAEKPAAPAFTFGAPSKPAEPSQPAPSPFAIGAPPAEATKEGGTKSPPGETTRPSSLSSLFGPSPTTTPFTFGAPTTPTATESAKAPFTFGKPAAPSTTAPGAPSAEAAKPVFSFGQPAATSTQEAQGGAKAPFSFGAPPSTPSAPAAEKKTPFTFGAPAPSAPASGAMLFGAPSSGTNGTDVSSKPFSFGAPTTPARQITPPSTDQEIQMDESPSRGVSSMDVNGSVKSEAMKQNGGFSFGGAPSSTAGTSAFGQATQAGAGTFGGFGTSGATGGFGGKVEAKPSEKPATTFGGFGQPSTSSFSFGAKPADGAATPTATSPFSFGQTPTTPTASGPSFAAFGAPAIAASTSFGQPTSATSAPASPSPFGQPTAFSFGSANPTPTTATATSNPFAFTASQPASPAASSAGLPGTAGAFTFGQPSAGAPTSTPSPFGAPASLPSQGGAVFNMGAAPPPTPGPGGRPTKKLPTRRGGKR